MYLSHFIFDYLTAVLCVCFQYSPTAARPNYLPFCPVHCEIAAKIQNAMEVNKYCQSLL